MPLPVLRIPFIVHRPGWILIAVFMAFGWRDATSMTAVALATLCHELLRHRHSTRQELRSMDPRYL